MADQNAMTMMFYARLQNDVSKVLTQIETDAKKSFDSATGSANKFGDSTQNLTKWIKEQRAEQRQHNFLFQQTREVVSGASTVLALFGSTVGQSSEEMKRITNALNGGFVAFQGINNVVGLLGTSIKALAGPWGIVIALAGAAAVAISQMSGESNKAAAELFKLEGKLIDLKLKLGEIAPAMKAAFLQQDVVRAENDLKRLNEVSINWGLTLTNFRSGMFQGIVYTAVGTPEEVKKAEIALREARLAVDEFRNSTEGFVPINITPTLDMDYILGRKDAIVELEKATITSNKKISVSNVQTAKDYLTHWDTVEKLKLQLREESFIREQELLQNYQQSSMMVFQTVGSLFGNMLTGQDANAKSILKNIANSFITMAEAALFAATAMASAKSIMTFWTSMAKDAPLLILGFTALESARAMVNSFHQGGSMFIDAPASQEVPVSFMARGQEKVIVQTEAQQQGGGGGGTIINFNFNNAIITTKEAFKMIVQEGMREMGVTDANQYFRNDSKGISLAY